MAKEAKTDTQLKVVETFVFDDGVLSINMAGFGHANGWGQLWFDEKQVDVIPYEDRAGARCEVEIPGSELMALRDFLNRIFPLSGIPAARAEGRTP